MNFIYKTIPRHTEKEIVLNSHIEVHFMIDINQQTMKNEHFILLNMTEQKIEVVNHEYQRRKLKISPIHPFRPNCHYQLQIIGGEQGVKDITGRAMPDTYEIEFYTKDVEGIKPPKILSPTNLVEVRENPSFKLQSVPEANHYELQISKSNTFHNLEWPVDKVYQITDTEIIPDITYETGQYYTRVRSVDTQGNKSSWSPTVQFYYNGAPIIQVAEDPEIPTQTDEETDIVTAQTKRNIILQPKSQMQEMSQVQKMQNIFSAKSETLLTGLYVKKTKPADKSVNNSLDHAKEIVIEFTEDIDAGTVDSNTCYLLSERN